MMTDTLATGLANLHVRLLVSGLKLIVAQGEVACQTTVLCILSIWAAREAASGF